MVPGISAFRLGKEHRRMKDDQEQCACGRSTEVFARRTATPPGANTLKPGEPFHRREKPAEGAET